MVVCVLGIAALPCTFCHLENLVHKVRAILNVFLPDRGQPELAARFIAVHIAVFQVGVDSRHTLIPDTAVFKRRLEESLSWGRFSHDSSPRTKSSIRAPQRARMS